MPLHLLPTLLLYILTVGYSPGPANIFSLSCSLRYGWRRSMQMWWGLLAGYSIAVTIVAMICWSAGTAMMRYVDGIRYIGAAYIVYLAWCTYRSADHTQEATHDCTFVSGAVVQLTNAKMIVFDFMVLGMFVMPYSTRLVDYLAVGALLLLAGPGANFVWMVAGVSLRRLFTRHRQLVNLIMAIALLGCAVNIMLAS